MPPFTQKQKHSHEDDFMGLDAANKKLRNIDSKDLRKLLVSESISFLTETKKVRCNMSQKINNWTGEIDDIKAKIDHVLHRVKNVNSKATNNRSSIQHLGGEVYDLATRINHQQKLFKLLLGPANKGDAGKGRRALDAPVVRHNKKYSGGGSGKIRKYSSKTNLISTNTNSILNSVYSSKDNTIKKRTISRTNSIRMTSHVLTNNNKKKIITTEELRQVDTISTTESIAGGDGTATASVSRTNSITKRKSITRRNSVSKAKTMSFKPQITTRKESRVLIEPVENVPSSIEKTAKQNELNTDVPTIDKTIALIKPNKYIPMTSVNTKRAKIKTKIKTDNLPMIKNATGNVSDASLQHYISGTDNELSFCAEEDTENQLVLYKRFPQNAKTSKLSYNTCNVANSSNHRDPPPSYADFIECKILKKVRRYINVNSRQKAVIRHKINIALSERKQIGGKQPWKY